ncbi:hydroxypyruvate reductase protein (plasmid) [Sinorhizobium fredii NGR234]|uniref:Glycerate dehydrogenase / Hydroxypyruvate reductase n=1 Tax=Sinorhizobium fredii (strain NBRC 101917 / NGR234) TaxID=394 RepID=Q6W213_SINFN|nr:DUF4147 domain-containing protein [Sinorhizobium fredii]AAQ87205.1 Glycerate dehydrogenase / Hydroxypyruvate reductase [Sinorhizobium fredii NGR234]ACP23116.1 hydroxypyruvate reductase protein [Sinorhizobium fredii NGR234]
MELLAQSAQMALKMRSDARDIFLAGVEAVDPARAVDVALRQKQAALAKAHQVMIVAFGRAACAMAEAAMSAIGDKIGKAVVVTDHENLRPVEGARTLCAGYPAIDPGGMLAASEVELAVSAATPKDMVLVLVSAGGPAMLCAPPFGISLGAKIRLQDMLVREGADMKEILAVRHAVSRINDGRLAEKAGGAQVLSMIYSDVSGDEIIAVTQGPTARLFQRNATAIGVLEKYGLVGRTDRAILDYIRCAHEGRAHAGGSIENLIIGGNGVSLNAAAAHAAKCHGPALMGQHRVDEDAAVAAEQLLVLAREVGSGDGPLALVSGRVARGGRNHEIALRFALLAEREPLARPWVFLSGNTDGRHGPHRSVGAIVDRGSCSWMRQLGIDPRRQLTAGDASSVLATSGDLLLIGDTASNVTDIELILLG